MEIKLRRLYEDETYNYLEFIPVKNCPGFSHRIRYNDIMTNKWLGSDWKPSRKTAKYFLELFRAESIIPKPAGS